MLKRAIRLLMLYILILATVFSALPLAYATPTDHPNTYKNTGNMRADIIGVALTQVGYYEGKNNDTKYGVWYGLNYRGWCGMFVAWCADQAGIPKAIIPKNGTTYPSDFNAKAYSGKNYRPQPGDLFFTPSGNGYSHTGIVYYLDGDYFYTIEGNTYHNNEPEGVYISRRKISDYVFGVPNYPVGDEHVYHAGYESAHPHKEYYRCDHCGDQYYTGKTKTSSSCQTCIVANCSHSYGKWKSSGSTQHTRSCTKCGKKETGNHSWDSGKTTKEPTCAKQGQTTYTCTGCGATRTATIAKLTTHTYGDWSFVNKTQHSRVCQVCSKKETANHKLADTWSSDRQGHWYACTDCQGKLQEEKHQFGALCDSPCQVCGYSLEGSHWYSADWETDDAEHWRICEVCDTPSSKAVHLYDNPCDGDCSICGYVRQVSHSFSTELRRDEAGHWRECEKCGLTQAVQRHQPGAAATEEHGQFCTLCGWELAPKLVHSHQYEPVSQDVLTHYMVCSCGERLAAEGHTWDAATLGCSVCGFSLKSSLPTLLLLCVVPATGVLFGLILLLHWMRRRFR